MQDKFNADAQSENDKLIEELLRKEEPQPEEAPEPFDPDEAEAYATQSAEETMQEPEESDASAEAADVLSAQAPQGERAERTTARRAASSHAARASGANSRVAGEAARSRRAEAAKQRKKSRLPAPKTLETAGKHPETTKHKKRRRRTNLPFALIWTTLVVAIAIVLSVSLIALGKDMYAVGKTGTDKILVVPSGASTAEIAQLLYDEDIIRVPKLFRMFSKLSKKDGQYVAGEHVVNASYSYEKLISALTTVVKAKSTKITIPEGTRLIDAAAMLEEAGVCDASRFIYFFNAGGYHVDFESKLPTDTGSKFYKMEGYLFPDTYEFYLDMEPELVCQKIYKRFNEIMSKGVVEKTGKTYYETMTEKGVSLDYVITLASIIQQEAPSMSSMQMVSSVFWNRLNNRDLFPLLQSDPTSKYVTEVIKPNISVANDVIFQSYDTYKGQGLPPGAICNPGKDAIEAALNPAQSEYYFFYANVNTKQTYFAKTNEEHEQNIQMVKNMQSGDELADDGSSKKDLSEEGAGTPDSGTASQGGGQ